MNEVEQLVSAGRPTQALAAAQQLVRTRPEDAKLRVLLFQLLAVAGQWQRAASQLELCGELDDAALAMVSTYREALKCELVRESVFEGKTTPMVLGQPAEWVALLVQALQAHANGDAKAAHTLRAQALEQATPTAGTLDGAAFEWICDADSRLGPVLEAVVNGRYCWVPLASLSRVSIEAPADLRDLVWTPAHLQFPNGGESVALIPTRYPRSTGWDDERVWMARRTEWQPIGDEQYAGVGQRVFATDAGEHALLEVRSLELKAA
jgi:type VI secretion system protein ImpE